MSWSRDKFIEAMKSRGMWHEGAEWVIDANLDAHAHELAERIRSLDPIEAALAGMNAWNDAADLIDPEVTE